MSLLLLHMKSLVDDVMTCAFSQGMVIGKSDTHLLLKVVKRLLNDGLTCDSWQGIVMAKYKIYLQLAIANRMLDDAREEYSLAGAVDRSVFESLLDFFCVWLCFGRLTAFEWNSFRRSCELFGPGLSVHVLSCMIVCSK